jgi:diguanylate cyclase (GGDEF)-like protein
MTDIDSGDGPRAGRRRGTIIPALGRGELSIWLLSAAMIAGAGALLTLAGVGSMRPTTSSMRLPWWALILAFAVAEHLVVHVHFRRSSHSMSLGEIPLVFALLYSGGWTIVIAYTVGRACALVLMRLPAIRLMFNAAQFALGGCLTVLTFHALSGSATTDDPRIWLAAAVAATVASAFAVLMITVAVSLSEGRLTLDRIVSSLRTDLTVTLANTSIGLCAARLVEHDWRTAVLLVVPVLGMFVTMRAYAAERARHGRLEFLYDAARALSGAAGTGEAFESMLTRSLEAFRTETAEIIFFSPDGDEALRTAVNADGRATLLEPLGVDTAGRLRAAMSGSPTACAAREVEDAWLTGYLSSRGLGDGLFATLQGEHSCIGAIALGDPSGVVDRFGADDVKLFETLAANTSVALENDRLGHTVWQLRMLQSELEHQASHDPLTGLANRSLFSERLDGALARERDDAAAVIFIDVNDFKMVNDTLGHAAGDELLVAISGRLSDCLRPSDTLARLGGDEFAVLLDDGASQDQAVEIAERIDRRMEERFSIAGELHVVQVSIGIALGETGGMTSEQLIRNADLAMYRAKQAKRTGYQLFESGMEVSVLHQHGLRRRLQEATQRDAFSVHYQPIVDLGTGAITAREALVRWVDGPRGSVGPTSFIPVAEELGVIVTIGRRILHRACREAQTWRGEDHPAPAVHVNISPIELRDEGFLPGVHSALEQSGLDPHRLVLEITEGVLLSDPARCVAILQQLRGLGVQLALDDFGTGYSSLSQLRGLPLDWLKLGPPFVDDLESEGTSQPFVRMIIALAGSLGVRVVAEEIESNRQMQQLRALGCNYGQGFYLGEPVAGGPNLAPVVATSNA